MLNYAITFKKGNGDVLERDLCCGFETLKEALAHFGHPDTMLPQGTFQIDISLSELQS